MTIENTPSPKPDVSCRNCAACCCRLEVVLFTENRVPEEFVAVDEYLVRRMARLDDGWCSALDRQSMTCVIYDRRPQVCRDFEVGNDECLSERAAAPFGILPNVTFESEANN